MNRDTYDEIVNLKAQNVEDGLSYLEDDVHELNEFLLKHSDEFPCSFRGKVEAVRTLLVSTSLALQKAANDLELPYTDEELEALFEHIESKL